MDLKTAIKIMQYHQDWRLGKVNEWKYTAKELTQAIDIVLRAAKMYDKLKPTTK